MRKPVQFFLFVAAGIGIDLLSKSLVFNWLADRWTYPLIPGVLQFSLAENPGVAFSLLKGHPALIVAFTSLTLCFLIWLYLLWRHSAHILTVVAIALLVVGAAGNLIDRLMLQYVRDFIEFVPLIPGIGHWAVFNVADICITAGVILFMIAELFFAKREGVEPKPAPLPDPDRKPL